MQLVLPATNFEWIVAHAELISQTISRLIYNQFNFALMSAFSKWKRIRRGTKKMFCV